MSRTRLSLRPHSRRDLSGNHSGAISRRENADTWPLLTDKTGAGFVRAHLSVIDFKSGRPSSGCRFNQ